jgi:hypothetical protein
MSVRKAGGLAMATVVVAASVLVSHLAAGQVYYPPSPPPARMYYPPPLVQPGDLPAMAQPYARLPGAQANDREDREDGRIKGHEDRQAIGRQDREDDDDRNDRDNRSMTRRDDRPAADATPDNQNGNIPATTTTPVHPVSLRDGPTGNSSVIGTLRPGMPLEVLGTNGGWVQVRSSAGTGWAWGSYLAIGTHGIAAAFGGDVGNNAAQIPDVVGAPTAKHTDGGSAVAANSAAKPAGTANPALTGGPALAGGGPALGIGRPAEPGRSGLASQITSP